MKKSKTRPIILTTLVALLIAAVCAFCGFFGGNSSTALADAWGDHSEVGPYAFYYKEFNVTYDIKSNREIEVLEELTVHYKGFEVTGFMRDIPTNGGELVKNMRVTEVINGEETDVAYSVENYEDDDNNHYVTANIGNYRLKRDQIHTYNLYYTYCLTKAQEGENNLALNVIGPQDRRVESADITIKLPEGFQGGTYVLGTVGTTAGAKTLTPAQVDGRTVVSVTGVALKHNEGITFDLAFAEGSLTTYFDFTPYWFLIAGAVLLILLFAVKFLVFNKYSITPVVNFEAPERMDPLMMGKLIDGSVDPVDITSMIFYWADKGYLKIDLDNQNDPSLIRIVQNLPEGTFPYEATLFSEMFNGNDVVKPSMLKNRFYKTIDKVKVMVDSRAKGLHSKNSMIVSAVFALFGGLLVCLAPLLLSVTQVSSKLFVFVPVFTMLPLLFVYLVMQTLRNNSLKSDKKLKAVLIAFLVFACLFAGLIYFVVTPSYLIGTLPKFLLVAMGCITVISSTFIISRTKEYTEKLNDITGFRQFILLAEKDRLEKMIEDDPQFYYHVLPYAQVLGVSDKWEGKFKDITVEPPHWATSSTMHDIVTFHVLNSTINNSMRNMAANLGSRPSSSGGSGRGGFGGGHVGGGHGGGGSRGR